MSDRLLLLVCVFAIYIFDNVAFLYSNEALVVVYRGSRFRIRFANTNYIVMGRSLALPMIFGPVQPVFRVMWGDHPRCRDEAGRRDKWFRQLRIYSQLAFLTGLLMTLLVVGVPMALFAPVTLWYAAAIVGIYYAVTTVALFVIVRNRFTLDLSVGHLVGVILQSLICAPCAANLVQKLSLGQNVPGDLVDFLRVRLSVPRFLGTIENVTAIVSGLEAREGFGSCAQERLFKYRKELRRQCARAREKRRRGQI